MQKAEVESAPNLRAMDSAFLLLPSEFCILPSAFCNSYLLSLVAR